MLDTIHTRCTSEAREQLVDVQPHPDELHIIHLIYVQSTGCYLVRVIAAGSAECLRTVLETSEDAARTLFLRLALSANPETHTI